MAGYEFFKREIKIRGKHARMASELWTLNDYEHTYLKRLIDLYILAAVVGFRANRKSAEDYSPIEPKTVFLAQVLAAKEDLDFIMQMMIMLDSKDKLENDACVKMAFRGAASEEEFAQWQNLFDSYVRGGMEELYEKLVVKKADSGDDYYDNKTANLMSVLRWLG